MNLSAVFLKAAQFADKRGATAWGACLDAHIEALNDETSFRKMRDIVDLFDPGDDSAYWWGDNMHSKAWQGRIIALLLAAEIAKEDE